MTTLMDTLYTFAQENLVMDYLSRNQGYSLALQELEGLDQAIQAALAPDQRPRLERLRDKVLAVHLAELEAIFQAGFSMALELGRA